MSNHDRTCTGSRMTPLAANIALARAARCGDPPRHALAAEGTDGGGARGGMSSCNIPSDDDCADFVWTGDAWSSDGWDTNCRSLLGGYPVAACSHGGAVGGCAVV